MCSGPILSRMLVFTLPLMCSSVLQLLFNAADIVVVGRFAGDASLAAVGSTSSLINLLTTLFIGLSIGANVLVARYFGAQDLENVRDTVHTAMLLSVCSGLLLTVIGIVGARPILQLMQTPDEVLPLATLYLRIYFVGITASMVYNFGSAILRAVGDTRRPLYYLLLAGVLNVILNLVFVIAFKMDVAGVGLATAISECVSAVLVVRCLCKEQGAIHLELRALHIHRDKLARILEIGLPAGFQGMVFALSNVVVQSAVNGFGSVIVAGNAAAANIEGFVYVAMNAFYQAVISFVSQNYGARKMKRINRITITGECCVVVVGLVLGNLAVLFGPQLLSIYTGSPEVVEAGMRRMSVIARTYALCGVMDVMVGALRGVGYSVMPMIVSLVGACGLRLAWIATVFQIPALHTTHMLYISYPISWAITAAVHILCFVMVKRHLDRLHQQNEVAERLSAAK